MCEGAHACMHACIIYIYDTVTLHSQLSTIVGNSE